MGDGRSGVEKSPKLRKLPTSLISDATAPTTNDFRSELRTILDYKRRDAAVFAITTVVLTPFIMFIAVLVLFFALAYVNLPIIDHLGYGLSFVTGINLMLAFMVVSFYLRPKAPYQQHDIDVLRVTIALGFLCVLIAFHMEHLLSRLTPHIFGRFIFF